MAKYYVVKAEETLTKIAKGLLGDASRGKIEELNAFRQGPKLPLIADDQQ